MKRELLARLCSLCLVFAIIMSSSCVSADSDNGAYITINIPENTEMITKNPGKGWVRYGDKNTEEDPVTSQKALEYSSVAYARWAWYQIEPNEGEYNWKIIDDVIAYWDKYDIKLAFGIMNLDSSNRERFITPQWVFDAGAKYQEANVNPPSGSPFVQVVPDWNDEVFKTKLKNFVNAMAARYDNDPRVAWVEIRSFGNYGEWHMGRYDGMTMPSRECQTDLAQIYVDAFKNKKLFICAGALREENVGTDYILNNNIDVRADGAYLLMDASVPGIADRVSTCSELINPYNGFVKNYGFNEYEYINFFTKFKQSYMDLGEWGVSTEAFIRDKDSLIRRLTNKMGYHFVLQNVSVPKSVSNDSFNVNFNWVNKGITFLHEKCNIAVAVLDKKDNVVKKYWSSAVPTDNWAPDTPVNDSIQINLNGLSGNEYKIAVGLFTDVNNENPDYKIGNFGRTENGWYPVATALKQDSEYEFRDCVRKVNINGEFSGVKVLYYDNEEYIPISVFKNVTAGENGDYCWRIDGTELRVDSNDDLYINGIKSGNSKSVVRDNGNVYCSKKFISELDFLDYAEKDNIIYITDAKRKYNEFSRAGKIFDAGFELGNNTWSYDDKLCYVTDAQSSEGKYSLRFDNSNDASKVYQTITLEPDTLYRLEFDAKTDSPLYCKITNPDGEVMNDVEIVPGDGEWQRYKLQFDSADAVGIFFSDLAAESTVTINFESGGAGQEAYLDNFSLVKISNLGQWKNKGYIIDYGAEASIYPWRIRGNSVLSRAYGVSHSGNYSFKLEYTGQWSAAQTDVLSLISGQGIGKYCLEFWARTDFEDLKPILVMPVKYGLESGAQGEISSKSIAVTQEWQKFKIDFEIKQEYVDVVNVMSSAITIIGNGSLDNIGKSIYFDDVELTKID